jgi:uncharacterized protein (DUF305 family)
MTSTAAGRGAKAHSALAAAALSAGLILGGVAAAAPAQASGPAASEQAASYEARFLTRMVDHHQMAVMMAQECRQKAVHPELAQLCSSIVQTQSAQIAQMLGWLQDWYGITHAPSMARGQMQSMERFSRLSGAEYEIRFMRAMIRHHWSAVREAESCLSRAEHPELLSLCSQIRTAQLGEIARMQGWLQDWYGQAGGRPAGTG